MKLGRYLLIKNPGRTRRIRVGGREMVEVEIDRATARILGGVVPASWIGVPYKRAAKMERDLRRLTKRQGSCERLDCGEVDKIGRRKRCRTMFRTLGEGRAELEAASSGIYEVEQGGDEGGAHDLIDAINDTIRGRGRRKLRTIRDAVRWAMPSSRRFEDFTSGRLGALQEILEAAAGGKTIRSQDLLGSRVAIAVVAPHKTDVLREARAGQRRCFRDSDDEMQRILEAARRLIEDAPF